jgi:hypothetical protein
MAASQVGGLMEGDPGPILAGLGSSFLFLQRWGLWFYHLNRLDLWRWFIQYNTVLFHSELSSGTSLWNIYIYVYSNIDHCIHPHFPRIFQYSNMITVIFQYFHPNFPPLPQYSRTPNLCQDWFPYRRRVSFLTVWSRLRRTRATGNMENSRSKR